MFTKAEAENRLCSGLNWIMVVNLGQPTALMAKIKARQLSTRGLGQLTGPVKPKRKDSI